MCHEKVCSSVKACGKAHHAFIWSGFRLRLMYPKILEIKHTDLKKVIYIILSNTAIINLNKVNFFSN